MVEVAAALTAWGRRKKKNKKEGASQPGEGARGSETGKDLARRGRVHETTGVERAICPYTNTRL
jgi:hypothetical protein